MSWKARKALTIVQDWLIAEFQTRNERVKKFKDTQQKVEESFGRRGYLPCPLSTRPDRACPRDSRGRITCDCVATKYKAEIVYLDLLYFYCNKVQLTLGKPPLNYARFSGISKEECGDISSPG